MSAPVDVLALRDCRACGGAGCHECGDEGVEEVVCAAPPANFTVRSDTEGFDQDRQECPCYEGVKINHGVDQCTHPGNRAPENWCDRESCPLLRGHIGGAA